MAYLAAPTPVIEPKVLSSALNSQLGTPPSKRKTDSVCDTAREWLAITSAPKNLITVARVSASPGRLYVTATLATGGGNGSPSVSAASSALVSSPELHSDVTYELTVEHP